MNRKSILLVLIVIIIIGSLIFSQRKTNVAEVPETATPQLEETALCFLEKKSTTGGLFDEYNLSLTLIGQDVDGSFQYLPAEKDQKTGTFVGTVDEGLAEKQATLWWSTMAEGMTAQEELLIRFNDIRAEVAFGEMVDKGDGTFTYKDKTKLSWLSIPQVPCSTQ